MISTGAFQTEMNSSSKQQDLVKKLTAAWEKKNSKTARAGGLSLMALSLAACGSDDDTPFSQADVDAAVAASEAALINEVNTSFGTAFTADDESAVIFASVAASDNAPLETAAAEALVAQAAAEADAAAALVAQAAAEADAATALVAQAAAEADAATALVAQAAAEASLAAANTAKAASDADAAAANTAKAAAEASLATAQASLTAKTAEYDALLASNTTLQASYDALVAPVSSAMTTLATDIINGSPGNDNFTAVVAAAGTTFQAGDIISDGSSTDSDTLTITASAGIANGADARVIGVENVVINYTGWVDATFDLDDVAASSYTLNNLQTAGNTGGTFTDVNSGSTVTGGSGVTGTLVVNAENSATALTVVSGSDITVTQAAGGTAAAITLDVTSSKVGTAADNAAISIDGSALLTDVANISVAGTASLDTDGATLNQVETVNISGNGAATTVAMVGAPTVINTTGDQNVTISGRAADFTGKAITGSSSGTDTVQITTAGVLNTSKFSVDNIITGDNANNSITVASGQNIQVEQTQTTGTVLTAALASATTNTINIDVNDAAAAVNTIDLVATTSTNIATVNVTATDNVDFGAVNVGTAGTLNISGAGTAAIAASSTAKAVDASGMTGALTATLAATATTMTGGAGKDNFTLAGDINFTIDGGANSDTLTITSATTDIDFSNNTTTSLTGVENIVFNDTNNETTHTFKSSVLNNASLIVKGEGATTKMDHLGVVMNETSVNLAGITIDAAMDDITVTSTAVAASALEVTGSAGADIVTTGSQSDIINLGEGNNTVVDAGDGDDTITAGAGNDTVTQSGSGNDTISLGNGTNTVTDAGAGNDVITTGSGTDTITTSGAGNDTMTLGNGANTADGNSGDDSITGGTGVDTFTGGAGKDVLVASSGADIQFGDNGGNKESNVITITKGKAADTATVTVMGQKSTATVPALTGSATAASTKQAVASAIATQLTTDFGDVLTATATTGKVTVTSKIDGNLTDFSVAYSATNTAGSFGTKTDGTLSAGGVDTINAGTGADIVVGGEGADVIDLGADTDADVIYVTAAMGGDTITNFAAGTGADTIRFNVNLFENGTEGTTLKSIASNGVIANNDVFVEITTATAAGGADTAAEVAAFLVNLDSTNVAAGTSDIVLLAVNDGTDMYLWSAAEAGTADFQAGELTFQAKLTGVTDIANGDFAFIT